MKYASMLAMTLALAAGTAQANDHLTGIRDHARELSREYRAMEQAAKDKRANLSTLQPKLESSAERVHQLKSLVEEFEASDPDKANTSDWKLTRDLVTLINVFHDQKLEELKSGDPQKDLVRGYAKGLALRAEKLQATADRALKSFNN